jgi:hypothetical protein
VTPFIIVWASGLLFGGIVLPVLLTKPWKKREAALAVAKNRNL